MEKTDMQSSNQDQHYAVKVIFGDDKRIVVLERPSYDLLANKVATTLGLSVGSFVLRYLDDEKDLITTSSDEELQLALDFAAVSGTLRLEVALLQPQFAPPHGEKRRRQPSSSDLEAVDEQAVAFLVQQMREKDVEVKPKKCAKFLRRTHGDVAEALEALDAWCLKKAGKIQRKKEKKALKQKLKGDLEKEVPGLQEKLAQLEAKGYTKTRKNIKLLAKCDFDVEKVVAVFQHKEAKHEAKKHWKSMKKARKCHKREHKRGYKCERNGGKASYKEYKKHFKQEAKHLKRMHRHGFQELAAESPSSPMTVGA